MIFMYFARKKTNVRKRHFMFTCIMLYLLYSPVQEVQTTKEARLLLSFCHDDINR